MVAVMNRPEIQRWAAFSSDPNGGNPAGVVLDADGLDDSAMLGIAAELGYAETAFVTGTDAAARRIRYFSPIAEVPFCGHATVAAAAALAETEGDGELTFATPVGEVEIVVRANPDGPAVSFTSVEPDVAALPEETLSAILSLLGLHLEDLHPRHHPVLAFGGNWHPLIVLRDRDAFDGFSFHPAAARALMDAEGWPATIIVLWPDGNGRWQARNVFPVGTVVEDPATGAAAAATGGYLRATAAVTPPARIVIEQGGHVGRPSELVVDIPATGGIVVSGAAVRIG
jgi:PhzF family phenazine biosynthesis protein